MIQFTVTCWWTGCVLISWTLLSSNACETWNNLVVHTLCSLVLPTIDLNILLVREWQSWSLLLFGCLFCFHGFVLVNRAVGAWLLAASCGSCCIVLFVSSTLTFMSIVTCDNVGTCHLAGTLLSRFRVQQPELDISDLELQLLVRYQVASHSTYTVLTSCKMYCRTAGCGLVPWPRPRTFQSCVW